MKPEIVSESKAISEMFGVPRIPKMATYQFPKDKATIRCHSINSGKDCSLTLYYKGNDSRISIYNRDNETRLGLSAYVNPEDLQFLAETVNEVLEKRKALAG